MRVGCDGNRVAGESGRAGGNLDKLSPNAIGRLCFLAGLFTLCGLTAFIGVVPTHAFGHDDFFLLDNGWRLVCGLRPHLDFFSPHGPLTFLGVAAGLHLSNCLPDGIGYGNAIYGAVIGLWAWWLANGRLHEPFRTLYALFLTALTVAPYALGTWPTWLSHAMAYNRHGFALLSLVLLECMAPLEWSEDRWRGMAGGASTGAALGLALFLKASYFVAGFPLLLLSILFPRPRRFRLLGVFAGLGLTATPLGAYLSFDTAAIAHDLRIAAGARSSAAALMLPDTLRKLVGQIPYVLETGALIWGLSVTSGAARCRGRVERHGPLIWSAAAWLCGLALALSNMQILGAPLLAVFAIVAAQRLKRMQDGAWLAGSAEERGRGAFVLAMCGLLVLPPFAQDLFSMGYGAVEKATVDPAHRPARFTEPRIASIVLYDNELDPSANGAPYIAYVNDGTALLRARCGPRDRVLTMDMVNPFPYALGWPPAHGGLSATTFNYIISATMRPSDDEYFGDATVIMIPKRPALGTFYDLYYKGIYTTYSPGLLQRFDLAAESPLWRLYRRK
jgi:hypothetical protein